MSTFGVGTIIALPLLLLAAPVGAAAATGMAAYLAGRGIYMVGKGVVSVGKKVDEAVQLHIQEQAQIFERNRNYERSILEASKGTAKRRVEDLSAAQNKLFKRIKDNHEKTKVKMPEVSLPEAAINTPETLFSEPVEIFDSSDLRKLERQLKGEIKTIEQTLESMEGEEWQGLVETGDLRIMVNAVEDEIEKLHTPGPDDQETLYDLRQRLLVINNEIHFRCQDYQERNQEKIQAVTELIHLGELVESQINAAVENPTLQVVIKSTQEALSEAADQFETGNYPACLETVRWATGALASVSASLEDLRRENIESELLSLEKHIEFYNLSPDSPLTQPLRTLIAKTRVQLKTKQTDEARKTLAKAEPLVQKLGQDVRKNLKSDQQKTAANMIRETLEEMGYKSERKPAPAGRAVEFTATREDGPEFKVQVDREGLISYKAEKFGSTECQKETKRLFDLLKKKGMLVEGHTEITAENAAAHFREIMLRQGYKSIIQTRQKDGSVIISATKDGKEISKHLGLDEKYIPVPNVKSNSPSTQLGVNDLHKAQAAKKKRDRANLNTVSRQREKN